MKYEHIYYAYLKREISRADQMHIMTDRTAIPNTSIDITISYKNRAPHT